MEPLPRLSLSSQPCAAVPQDSGVELSEDPLPVLQSRMHIVHNVSSSMFLRAVLFKYPGHVKSLPLPGLGSLKFDTCMCMCVPKCML